MTTKNPPTIGRLLDSILRLRSKRHVACDEAVKRVHERFAGKETELLASVDEATRAKVVAMLDAEYDVEPSPPIAVPDLEPPATTPPPADVTMGDPEPPEEATNLPNGAGPYTPSPVAQRARAGR